MARKRKPKKLMSKKSSLILMAVSAIVLVGAIIAAIYLTN